MIITSVVRLRGGSGCRWWTCRWLDGHTFVATYIQGLAVYDWTTGQITEQTSRCLCPRWYRNYKLDSRWAALENRVESGVVFTLFSRSHCFWKWVLVCQVWESFLWVMDWVVKSSTCPVTKTRKHVTRSYDTACHTTGLPQRSTMTFRNAEYLWCNIVQQSHSSRLWYLNILF